MVAAFHSLVGLAATVTSIATIMIAADSGEHLDGVHMVRGGKGGLGAGSWTTWVACAQCVCGEGTGRGRQWGVPR